RKEKNRTIIKVIGNGPIGDFNAFTMDKPAPSRIVVDVWNVKSSIPGDGLAVGSTQIKKVRVGEHPDKVRLVFDSGQKNVPPYTIERVDNSLVITAGVIDVKKLETAAAVAPVSAPQEPSVEIAQQPSAVMPAPEPIKADYAEIKAVDFKQLEDKARLIITASKKMEYRLLKLPDETGLALDIKDAIIPDELKRTLDASDLNTPVASISSFQSPVEPAKDVRILVKLKEKVNYDISQEGERIQIDFPLLAAAQAVPKMAEAKNQGPVVSGQGSEEAKEIKETKSVEEKKEQEQASGYTGRKISLDFKDADISNILRLMAEVSNLNIIAGEDVKGKVSLRLIDVPWDQAFEIILKTNGLGKVQEGNVVRI
ncbi:MAG: AMIN domain-containing protein, partial [Deltaproteobacteria bacterium]